MMFRRGHKVTMKTDRPFNGMLPNEAQPKYGEVYTIRELESFGGFLLGLRFEEIINPVNQGVHLNMECHFTAGAFRPVVNQNTDISIFKKMEITDRVHAQ